MATKSKKKKRAAKPAKLTKEQIAALAAVKDGADVYSYGIALRLREVELSYPGLVDIGPAMTLLGSGAARQPYFGAILTAAGKEAIGR